MIPLGVDIKRKMKKFLFIITILTLAFAACKKHKDTTPPPQQDLWPTKLNDSWTYKISNYAANGTSTDGGLYTITFNASKTFGGKTYIGMDSLNMYFENEGNTLYVTDSIGSYFNIQAKSLENTDTLFKETTTYKINTAEYSGTLARVASAFGTILNGYTCVEITDLYYSLSGKLAKKVITDYSPGTGPVGIFTYTNPENPNNDSLYRTQSLLLDSHNLN